MNRSSINASTCSPEEAFLTRVWMEACVPLRDDRPEIIAWYEERKADARNALIQYRKLHGHPTHPAVARFHTPEPLRALLHAFWPHGR